MLRKKNIPFKFQVTIMFLVSLMTSVIVLAGFIYYLEAKAQVFKSDEEFQASVAIGVESYMQALRDEQMAKVEELKNGSVNPPAKVPKADKPSVELFVMSHCPFGTQIEKGILPVAYLLEDKIDFELKFVDYAMHPDDEIKEQKTQYCIQQETDKILGYLSCYLKEGNQQACLEETGIDQEMITSCEERIDEEYQISENFADQTTWKGRYPPFNTHQEENKKYGVTGSPTLVINGTKVQTNRDSQSILQAVCNGFKNQPAECEKELPTESPAPGFGFGNATNALDLSCIE